MSYQEIIEDYFKQAGYCLGHFSYDAGKYKEGFRFCVWDGEKVEYFKSLEEADQWLFKKGIPS